jgi:hypothetical protein
MRDKFGWPWSSVARGFPAPQRFQVAVNYYTIGDGDFEQILQNISAKKLISALRR